MWSTISRYSRAVIRSRAFPQPERVSRKRPSNELSWKFCPRPSVRPFFLCEGKKTCFHNICYVNKVTCFFLLRAGRIDILQSYPRSSVRFWKNIAMVYGFFSSTLAVFPASRTTVVAAINPNYLGLRLCLHYTRELCAARKIIPDRASFCSHLSWLDPVFFRGYHPTLKLSGIPTFTFIVSITHRMDNI